MNNTKLGISIALMTAALIVGSTLAYSSAHAIIVVGKNGGIGGNGANGGFHVAGNSTHAGANLNGGPGTNANGESSSS
jgi:hypothetical protein